MSLRSSGLRLLSGSEPAGMNRRASAVSGISLFYIYAALFAGAADPVTPIWFSNVSISK
jgi:hypothetical protein